MNTNQVKERLHLLRRYIEAQQFRGWDPFDGLNARLFQSLPLLKNNKWARLAWLQFFKRSPLNFRPLTGVPKVYNAKAIALFLHGYVLLYRLDARDEYLERIRFLAGKLLAMQSPGYAGAAWGYPFPWQARAFFQPKGTPTMVATSFAVEALLAAYEIIPEHQWLETALSARDFVLTGLNRSYDADGDFTFSYSPLDHTQVFNAGLLGAKTLALIYRHTGENRLLEYARRVVSFAAKHQRPDGAWPYGTLPYHGWTDSFHTGYNLEAIHEYRKASGDNAFDEIFRRGMDYYLNNFFTPEGIPKYYDNRTYPVEVHGAAQLIIVLHKTGLWKQHAGLARRVTHWTLRHLQSPRGNFHYRITRYGTNKIPYIRWSDAWMFYALSRYLAAENE